MYFEKYFKNRRQGKGIEIEDVTDFNENSSPKKMLISEPIDGRGFRFFRVLAIAVFFLLAFRVFFLQLLKGDYYSALARENRMRYVDIEAPRGLIYDQKRQGTREKRSQLRPYFHSGRFPPGCL